MAERSFADILNEKMRDFPQVTNVKPSSNKSFTDPPPTFNSLHLTSIGHPHLGPKSSPPRHGRQTVERIYGRPPKREPQFKRIKPMAPSKSPVWKRILLNEEQSFLILQFEKWTQIPVTEAFTLLDLKRIFRQVSKTLHPDLNTHLTPQEQNQRAQQFIELKGIFDQVQTKFKN